MYIRKAGGGLYEDTFRDQIYISSVNFFTSRLSNHSWWNTAGTPRVPCFPPHPLFVSINHDPVQSSIENRQVLLHPLSRSVHPQLFLLHLRLVLIFFESSFLRSLPPLACARSPLSAFLCGFAVFFWFVFFSSRFAQRRLSPLPLPSLRSRPQRAPLLLGSPA